ncbi:TPA: PD-(D/E)XK nuclease family protein [Clostridioides difficile]|uniref:PD-(D/E)XK nuclease family protein n=1 Tax=Clostridioides difficile TaxID=1496 RepID=UPI000B3D1ED0|nr:PD-(D/E)XK nuclease family protein [Clostridioides difficile]HBF8685581.1 PD-(D/E)XK nuclease family protein [Clostridioides difficile]
MSRKSEKYLDKIKEKYQVKNIYSWSRYNLYKIDPYSYLLKYILNKKETRQNIYGVSGGHCHSIIEDLYNGKTKYEDMIIEYEEKLFEMNLSGLKYNRNDEEFNRRIAKKYEDNIKLFFKEHDQITYKSKLEQFVIIEIGKYIFQGYIDFIYKDENGIYNIVDWKTSTIYTGKKIEKERGQLVLYAESLVQMGVPVEKIKIKWNFLKYCTVTQTLLSIDKKTKQHKYKNKNCLRTEWVKGIEPTLRKWVKKMSFDELEVEDMISTSIENNNLNNMPDNIKNKFKLSDCYVDIPLSQKVIDELKQDIIFTLDEINKKTEEYKKTKDDNLFWTEIDKSNEFYFSNLMGYSKNEHRPYKEYLEDLNMFKKEIEMNEDDSIDWLNSL